MRNLAAALSAAAGLPSIGVQGAVIERDALEALIERAGRALRRRARVARRDQPGRAGLILAGAVVIAAAMEVLGRESIEVTHAGLREGVFFSGYLARGRAAAVRGRARRQRAATSRASTRVTSRTQSTSPRSRASCWTHSTACSPRATGVDVGQILWAAGMLHDIGVSVDYDDHHKHSRYLMLAAGLPGFSQRELALIAQTVRYHRKGTPELGELAPLCHPRDGRLLTAMSALLRLAEHLDRGRDGAVTSATAARPGRSARARACGRRRRRARALGRRAPIRPLPQGLRAPADARLSRRERAAWVS